MNKTNTNTFLTGIDQKKNVKSQLIKRNLNKKEFLYKSKSSEQIIKENLFNFLINEKEKYLDFEKIEKYYQERFQNLIKKYNNNVNIIKKKKEEEKNLKNQFTILLINNLSYSKTLNEYYENIIPIIKRKILIKKLELDSYNHIYQRTYKNNYLIVKRLDDERGYFKISQNQYEKYLILEQHTLETLKKQEQLLNEMKSFDDRVQLGYESKINEKTKTLNQLEFEVFLLKKETKGIEKEIELKKLKQKKLKRQIIKYKNLFNQKYKIYFDEWSLYHYSNIRMYKIYNILNVKNLIDVIKEFKILQKKYNELSSLFHLHNKEINNLKKTITEIDKEYKNILFEIENKRHNKEKKSKYHQVYITKIQQLRFSNQIIRENYKDKSKTLKLILNFLLKHIETIINSLKNLSLQNYFTFNSYFKPKFAEKFLEKKSLSIHIDKMTLNSTFVIFVLSIFNNFANYFYLILASSSNIVFFSHLLKLSKKNKEKNNNNEIIKEPILNLENNFMIFTLNSDSLIETLNDEINFANIKQLEKQKILGRTEKDIFKNITKDENMQNLKSISSTNLFLKDNENNKTPSISKFNLLKDYGLFLKNKNMKINFADHQNSYLALINKYSNNLVNDGEDIKEIKRKKEIMNKTQLIKNLTYQRELIDFMKKKKKSFSDITNLEMNEDISDDEIEKYKNEQKKKIEEEIKESKKIKQFAMCSNNPEMILIYKRLNDLRQLNLHLVKDSKKFILDHDVFNSIYFNFKNKLLNQSKSQKKINEKKKILISKNKRPNRINRRNYSVIYKENISNSIIKNILSKTPIVSKDKINSLSHSNAFLSTMKTGINSYYFSTKNCYNNKIEFKTQRHRSLNDYHLSNILDNNSNNNSIKQNLSKNSNIEYDL